jgi:DNA-binding IclR family transcriptional regulator
MATQKQARAGAKVKGAPKAPRGIQSATVGLSVLKVLIESGKPLFLRELAAGVDMAASNVYRYLVSFGEAGMISQDARTGKYDLGPLAIQLGLSALRRIDAIDIAIEVLTNLVESTNTDGHLCVCGTAGVTVVRWKEGPGDISVKVREGHVLPFIRSATGRVWAAFLAPDVFKPLIERELSRVADETGTARSTLMRDLSKRVAPILATGISHSTSERREGIDAMCVPVFDRDGKLVLSITLLGTSARFDSRLDGPVVAQLRKGAEEISRRIGCGPVELARYPWLAAAT